MLEKYYEIKYLRVKEVCVSHSNFSFLMALDADALLWFEMTTEK